MVEQEIGITTKILFICSKVLLEKIIPQRLMVPASHLIDDPRKNSVISNRTVMKEFTMTEMVVCEQFSIQYIYSAKGRVPYFSCYRLGIDQ